MDQSRKFHIPCPGMWITSHTFSIPHHDSTFVIVMYGWLNSLLKSVKSDFFRKIFSVLLSLRRLILFFMVWFHLFCLLNLFLIEVTLVIFWKAFSLKLKKKTYPLIGMIIMTITSIGCVLWNRHSLISRSVELLASFYRREN